MSIPITCGKQSAENTNRWSPNHEIHTHDSNRPMNVLNRWRLE